ncbi:hypothetical protein ALC57_04015, partial [Trachymyrmex cornetzi]
SQNTKTTVLDVLKPARCTFKINKIAYALNKGTRIEANNSDLVKLKSCSELAEAGLRVLENIKVNPRIIVHGVSTDKTSEEIKNEIIVQNLEGIADHDLKVAYKYTPKENNKYTSCVLKVSVTV